MLTYAQAIAKYNGKRVDVDGFPAWQPYQCYDWATKYMQVTRGVSGNPICRPSGGVKDLYLNFANIKTTTGKYLKSYYNRVANQPWNAKQVPPRGAIIIWSGQQPGSGGFGHIGVVDSAWGSGFKSYDQNWGGTYVHAVNHNYSYILGWLVKK